MQGVSSPSCHPGFRGSSSTVRAIHANRETVPPVFGGYAAAMMYVFASNAIGCAKSPQFGKESHSTGERITLLDRFAQGVMLKRLMLDLLTGQEMAVMVALHSFNDQVAYALAFLAENIPEGVCQNRDLLSQLIGRHFEGRTSPRSQRSQRRIAHTLGLHLRSVQRVEDRVRRALHDLEDSGRDKILPFLVENNLIPPKIA